MRTYIWTSSRKAPCKSKKWSRLRTNGAIRKPGRHEVMKDHLTETSMPVARTLLLFVNVAMIQHKLLPRQQTGIDTVRHQGHENRVGSTRGCYTWFRRGGDKTRTRLANPVLLCQRHQHIDRAIRISANDAEPIPTHVAHYWVISSRGVVSTGGRTVKEPKREYCLSSNLVSHVRFRVIRPRWIIQTPLR